MKKILFTLLAIGLQHVVFSQYYYKDLLTSRQTNTLYAIIKNNGIKKVNLESYAGNTTESGGISIEQEIDLKNRIINTTTRTATVGNSYFTAQYSESGKIVESTDSAQNAINQTSYIYDGKDFLLSITSASKSDNITNIETHTWFYDQHERPKSMLRIRNNTDTTRVSFVLDEKGNVVEEKAIPKNLPPVTYYYYYDAQNRLTDIVRYNPRAKKLLPDYMFEYNEFGQLKKMVLVPEGSSDYQTWYYQYDANGLKKMELVYNKEQKLMGKVEYAYVQ